MRDATASPRTFLVKAEPLTAAAFAPFGQVVAGGDTALTSASDGDELTLDVIRHHRRDFVIDHLNRHHHATQTLVPLGKQPCVITVAPAGVDFSDEAHLETLRAFVMDGTVGITLALGTWHDGPWPLMDVVDLVNLQGRDVLANDNEVVHLDHGLGVVLGVVL